MPMKKSKFEQICEEVAYDLGLDKKFVKSVMKEVFLEVVSTLVLKKKHLL